jgi:septal ring factor EnvC (AmiA/AmiB activator)
MTKRRALLESMIRLQERDIQGIKTESWQAQQALFRIEQRVESLCASITDLENRVRIVLEGESSFQLDELQSQRRYLADQRLQLVELLLRRERAFDMAELIAGQLAQEQNILNMLYELAEGRENCLSEFIDKRLRQEDDEPWIDWLLEA